MTLWRIEAPHFVAGILVEDSVIVDAAPILRWTILDSLHLFANYCERRGWRLEEVA